MLRRLDLRMSRRRVAQNRRWLRLQKFNSFVQCGNLGERRHEAARHAPKQENGGETIPPNWSNAKTTPSTTRVRCGIGRRQYASRTIRCGSYVRRSRIAPSRPLDCTLYSSPALMFIKAQGVAGQRLFAWIKRKGSQRAYSVRITPRKQTSLMRSGTSAFVPKNEPAYAGARCARRRSQWRRWSDQVSATG